MDRKQGVITALAAGLGFVSTAGQAAAHCPLCTAAVGTGLITARLFGVNDIVSGIWVGAFIISIALWLDKALRRKYKPILGQGVILSVIAFLSTVIPFYFAGLFNTGGLFLGVEKLLFGAIAGSIITYLGIFTSLKLKSANENKVLFPFQTIVFVISFLTAASIFFWNF